MTTTTRITLVTDGAMSWYADESDLMTYLDDHWDQQSPRSGRTQYWAEPNDYEIVSDRLRDIAQTEDPADDGIVAYVPVDSGDSDHDHETFDAIAAAIGDEYMATWDRWGVNIVKRVPDEPYTLLCSDVLDLAPQSWHSTFEWRPDRGVWVLDLDDAGTPDD